MLTEVMAIDLTSDSLTPVRLKKASLDFEYRNSLFKKNPGRYIITSVTLRLDKQSPLKIGYGDIATQLNKGDICAQDVSNAVIAARQAKLPDVSKIPNAGSFFKNPVIDADKLDELQARFSGLISYELNDNTYKLAAGWLIQEAGWKGYCNDKVGVHDKQALVLVNHAGGEAKDILELARRIKYSVEEMFGVLLEVEPVIM